LHHGLLQHKNKLKWGNRRKRKQDGLFAHANVFGEPPSEKGFFFGTGWRFFVDSPVVHGTPLERHKPR
jgi:hypothetical protein